MNPEARKLRWLHACTTGSLIALIMLCLGWELWWAPLRPGGSLLVFKSLPLLLPLFGILRGKRYTFQWSSMFMLVYLMEGLVRATSDPGPGRLLALLETLLAVVFIICAIGYSRKAVAANGGETITVAD